MSQSESEPTSNPVTPQTPVVSNYGLVLTVYILYLVGFLTGITVVCTENSNSDIMVMQPAKDRVGVDASSSLNWARERRVLI